MDFGKVCCHAMPRHACWHATLLLPCHATLAVTPGYCRHTTPHHCCHATYAALRHATPRHACCCAAVTPRLLPCHATPRHATPAIRSRCALLAHACCVLSAHACCVPFTYTCYTVRTLYITYDCCAPTSSTLWCIYDHSSMHFSGAVVSTPLR